MFKQLPTLQNLIRQLQRIPYLASKNIYKVAAHLLSSDMDSIDRLCQSIVELKKNIRPCKICSNLVEGNEICSICSSKSRNQEIICVVETWHDLWAIEKTDDFRGVYHVLGGVLCPLEGIGAENLNIGNLIKRVNGSVKELIFATNPTPEGEATACLISSKILKKDIIISKLASGVPTGSSLEYMDRTTISKAMSGRRPF
jgi:recombination protein RecR